MAETLFDISTFQFQLPAPLNPTCQVDMNGLRFYGGQPWQQAAGSYTFGSDTPTFVLIGLVAPTFTPMLLVYGTVTLNTNNSGITFSNSVTWTQGLYTVANQLAVKDTTLAQVTGGMTVQTFNGGFYTDSLLNAGVDFTISSFANGTVTTSAPNTFTPGQNLQFSNLVNPEGGVINGTGYKVDLILSVTKFTIEALDGHDVSTASADGGAVTTIPSPSDSENWGALVPNGQQMQLTTTSQRTSSTIYAGFTPSRILYTKTTDAVPEPILQFSGIQTIEYKRSNLTAGLGFQSANDAQYLQINYQGYFQFVKAGNDSDNEIVFTVTAGATPAASLIMTNGIDGGVLTIAGQNRQTPLADGDWVHFINLALPTPADGGAPPLAVAVAYQVGNVTRSTFQLIDPATDKVGFADVNSPTAALIKEIAIAKIYQQNVTIGGESVQQTMVTTSEPHNLVIGDAIMFYGLNLTAGSLDTSKTYYVTVVYEDQISKQITSFSFAEERGGFYSPLIFPQSGPGGRVTLPLAKMYGFDYGGNVTVTATFNGAYQAGNWTKPTDFTIGISGTVSMSYLPEKGTSISGTFSAKGDSETSAGLVLQSENGHFSLAAGAFNLSGSLTVRNSTTNAEKVGVSLSGISGSGIRADDGTDTWSFNGSVSVTIPGMSWSGTVNFGHGQVNGLTLIDDPNGNRFVQEFAFAFAFNHFTPPGPYTGSLSFAKRLSIMGWNVSVDYNHDPKQDSSDWSLLLGGAITLAVGDPTPDANGTWQSTVDAITVNVSPGAIELYEAGCRFLPGRYELDVNGLFEVKKGWTFMAKSLKFIYQSADPVTQTDEQIIISGGVAFPDLANASVQLGNDGASGGLLLDVTKGTWKLNGWRVSIPKVSFIEIFDLRNFVLGFGLTTDKNGNVDWTIQAAGQWQILKGKVGGCSVGVAVTFERDNGRSKLTHIGASLRNMNPGILIPPIEGSLTDIAFDCDGIPGAISVDLLFGAVFGDKITVGAKVYDMVQAVVNGQYKYKDINVTGTVLIAGGTLGVVAGAVDLNWGTEVYSINVSGKAFYDVVDANLILFFSSDLDYGLFSAKLQVPPNIPIIGGTSVAEADAMYYVDHSSKTGNRFLAAWFVFLGHWKYGVEIKLVGNGQWSLIGTKTVDGLEADIPSGTGTKANKYNIAYSPTAPSLENAQLRGLEDDESSDSYGLLNVTWDKPDATDDTIFIASGDSDAVQVYGPGTATDGNGWVNDSNGGVSYMVLTDQSSPGNVLIHIAPTASFTAPGASYDDPDLYIPLPSASLNVVLTSDNAQSDNLTANWTGSFAAAAPQLQNVTVTQPKTVSALGDDESDDDNPDPVTADNAIVSFQWRGLDLDSTSISLYYDYDSSGYTGTFISTVTGDELTVSDPDDDGWLTVSVPWDIGDLDPARPLYVYAVIKDDGHAGAKSDYVGQVQTVPAAQVQVSYTGGTSVSSTELQDNLLEVTPVQIVNINSIAAGVVSVTDATNINAGDMFMFSGLTSPVGVANTMPYYVLDTTGETFTFSNVAAGAPLNEVTAGLGTAYVDQDVSATYGTNTSGLVWPHVDGNQMYRFSMAPPRTVFAAAPSSSQEVASTGELVQYNAFVGNNQLLRMTYQFKVLAAIAGRIYSDLSDNGQLDSMDTGLAGATVYLDDNNNNALDPGEDSVVTGPDGNFLFVHEWADTDTPTTTYTTWVKVIPPPGWKVTSSPSVPTTGITFTNDGNEQAALSYYNFMIASPVTIGGIVYDDANGNGVRDPGERGLPGVTVSVAPPSGSPIAATTDETGTWQATSYERGTYRVSIDLPSGGTFTTATSTLFTAGTATNIVLQKGASNTAPYAQSGLASQWNPASNSYSTWLAVLSSQTPRIDFANIGSSPTGNVNVVNTYLCDHVISRFDAFIGKWSSDGTPSLAVTYIIGTAGGNRGTELAITKSSPADLQFATTGGQSGALYALSYDSSQPSYSTVASIDNTGQVTLWKFDPSTLGGGGSSAFSPASQTFKLTQGTPVKIVGFNKAGSDHFQSQDLAVVYRNANGVLALAELNHATNAITTYAIGGRVFVDMIAGDFDDNGHEDIAVITADTSSRQYYLNILLSQDDGSTDLIPYVGNGLALATDGTPRTTLTSIRVNGGQQALLWNAQSTDGSTNYIAAALVTGGQIRVSSGAASLAGRVAALSAGDIGAPATFAVYSSEMSTAYNVPVAIGTVQVNADGKITITEDLTKYGGSFSGFDVGVTGVTPATSNVTSGIVYNDANSNGIQDPGEGGLPGITVRLIEPNNATQTAVTSNGNDGRAVGSYSFENVPSGAYIQVLLPPGTWTAENPPPGIPTNANGSDGIVTGVTFISGQAVETIGFTDGSDNAYSVAIKSADLQASGQENLVVRTSSALFVQRFQSDGTSVFDRYDVGSPAAYFRPQLYLEDINADGLIDIITSGQSGVDVFINIGLGEFRPFTGLLADKLTNSLNGAYGPGRGFTNDAESGVTPARTYTHALNFGGDDITVNGVTFKAAPPKGSNYTLAAADPRNGASGDLAPFPDFALLLDGNFKTIAQSSYQSPVSVNGTEQLALMGLTPGVIYATTFYTVGNNGAPHRIQTVVDSLGGTLTFDANGGENLNGYMVSRTFTAISDSVVFTFFAKDPNESFNLIAMTNEVAGVGYSAAVTFTNDTDSGIASGVHYTHILDFASAEPVTVNDVTFIPAGLSGPNWSLTGYDPNTHATPAMLTYTGFGNSLTGAVNSLENNFYYSPVSGEQLTLTGLAIGTTYTTTWYGVGFQDGIQRVAYITDSLGGSTVIDENLFGAGNGVMFSRTFTAANDSITFTFVAAVPGVTFNQYAMTNQLAAFGDYSYSKLSDDAGSGISSGKTYTHVIDWEGTEQVTVNGVQFQQAGRQGLNYSIVAVDPHTLAESEIEYFVNYVNNVTGELKSAVSNGYIGTAKVVLSGLTLGTTYMTTFYAAGDGDPGGRLQTISDSEGGAYSVDENMFGNGNGFCLTRTYTASSDSITFYIVGDNLQNPFLQGALTNEIVPASQQSPDIYGTELAVVPATSDTPARIYAAQQNTQTVYELAWDTATATLGATGRFFPLDRLVTRLVAGCVVNDGEVDLVVYENSNNGPADPVTDPGDASYQKLWVYTPGDLYTTGTILQDFDFMTYEAEVDLLLAPLFPGVQTVVFMGSRSTGATDVVTYRAGSGPNTTTLSSLQGLSLGVGQFVPGSRAPNILVAGVDTITVLDSGNNPNDANNPVGADPSVPLVVLGSTYSPHSWNAAAVGASVTTHSDDLMVVRYDDNAGFTIVPYFNITGAYQISGNAGGGSYDFPVVIPGSSGGTVNGNIFYDPDGNGNWDPTDNGAYDDITVYLDLNNNGQLDSNDPRAFPNRDGDYQFTQLLPGAYTINILVGTGYSLTTPASIGATVPAVPGAQVNGIDFGVKAKDFGADFNNDHQPDLLLSDPKDQSVHVQLRNGLDRLGTYKIGTLPSADWLVAGVHDITGNGTADVLIHNAKTGELRLWEFFPNRGTPTVARTVILDYVVPAGYALLGIADLGANGQAELILGHKSKGDHRAVELKGLGTLKNRKLTIPFHMSIVGAADIDRDGNTDLLLRHRKTGHLLIYLFNKGKPKKLVDLGKPKADWLVAGITGLLRGDQQEILFQEKSTGKGFAWILDANLNIASVLDLEIGTHDGLRMHLAER